MSNFKKTFNTPSRKQHRGEDAIAYFVMIVLSAIIILPLLYLGFGSFKPKEEMSVYPPTLLPQRWTMGNFQTLLQYPGLKGRDLVELIEKGELPPDTDVLATESEVQMFTEEGYSRIYANIFTIVVAAAMGVIIFAGMAGYAFAKVRFFGRETIFAMMVFTLVIPHMVVLVPQYLVFRHFGLVGTLWPFYTQELFFGLLNGGFAIFFFRQHFKTLPDEIIESATMDGAGHLRILFQLAFPLAKTVIITIVLFVFVFKWNDLGRAIIYLTKPALYIPTQVTYYLTRAIGNQPDPAALGLRMGAALLSVVPFLLVFIFGQRYYIRGITQGALKG